MIEPTPSWRGQGQRVEEALARLEEIEQACQSLEDAAIELTEEKRRLEAEYADLYVWLDGLTAEPEPAELGPWPPAAPPTGSPDWIVPPLDAPQPTGVSPVAVVAAVVAAIALLALVGAVTWRGLEQPTTAALVRQSDDVAATQPAVLDVAARAEESRTEVPEAAKAPAPALDPGQATSPPPAPGAAAEEPAAVPAESPSVVKKKRRKRRRHRNRRSKRARQRKGKKHKIPLSKSRDPLAGV